MQRTRLARLGLFQMAAGASSVLFLGVLNRVMRVELGIDLFAVSLLVGGGHYLGALVAIPFGYYSDTHAIAGYRRSIYALGGALITASILAASPYMAVWLSQNQTPLGLLLGFGFFLTEGISTYIAGTAYLALITDLTTRKERGPATAVVWTLLMVGIIAAGITASVFLKSYTFASFATFLLAGAAAAVSLAAAALFRQEARVARAAPVEKPLGLRESLKLLASNSQTRWFAGFLLMGMFSFFVHDVILEPFGGEVFGLSPGETARFNAFLGVGVISSMLLGGMWLIPRHGKPRVTAAGCWLMAASFGLLAYTGFAEQGHWLNVAIAFLGFGSGLFTVGGVSLMMDMTAAEHTGLFVGAWTLIQAVARGPASIAGGAAQTAFVSLGATAGQAYAGVFALEAVGVLLAIFFLSRVGVQAFQQQVGTLEAVLVQAVD